MAKMINRLLASLAHLTDSELGIVAAECFNSGSLPDDTWEAFWNQLDQTTQAELLHRTDNIMSVDTDLTDEDIEEMFGDADL